MFLMSLRQLQCLFLCDQLLTRLFKSTLMLLFFKIKSKQKNRKIKIYKKNKCEKKKVEKPNCFFELFDHQVCLETKQLKIIKSFTYKQMISPKKQELVREANKKSINKPSLPENMKKYDPLSFSPHLPPLVRTVFPYSFPLLRTLSRPCKPTPFTITIFNP